MISQYWFPYRERYHYVEDGYRSKVYDLFLGRLLLIDHQSENKIVRNELQSGSIDPKYFDWYTPAISGERFIYSKSWQENIWDRVKYKGSTLFDWMTGIHSCEAPETASVVAFIKTEAERANFVYQKIRNGIDCEIRTREQLIDYVEAISKQFPEGQISKDLSATLS